MIRVTVELLPFGDETRARVLGTAAITNDGTGTRARGNYRAEFFGRGGRRMWKKGKVKYFPRQRYGAWDLLYRALRDIVGDRNDG